MALQRRMAFAALTFLGCSESHRFIEAALPDQSTLIVVAMQGSRVAEVKTTQYGGPVELSEDAEDILVFGLPPGSVLDETGRPLEALTAEIAAQRAVCQVCPFPTNRLPMFLQPGARCPIPPDAPAFSASLSRTEIESARAAIELTREGPCSLRPSVRADPPPTVETTLLPGFIPQTLAPNREGGVFLLSERFVAIARDGQIQSQSEDVPFVGPILGATPVNEGLVVASLDLDLPGATRWTLLSPQLTTRNLVPPEGLAFRPQRLQTLGGNRFLGAGYRAAIEDRSASAQVVTCELRESLECIVELDDANLRLLRPEFESAMRSPTGVLAAITDKAELLIKRDSGTTFHVLSPDGQFASPSAYTPMQWSHERVWVCIHTGDDQTSVLSVSSTVANQWQTYGSWPNTQCRGSWLDGDEPRFVLADGRIVGLREGHFAELGTLNSQFGIAEAVSVLETTPGSLLLLGNQLGAYSGPAQGPLRQDYAAPWEPDGVAAGVVPGDPGSAWVVWQSGSVETLDLASHERSQIAQIPLAPLEEISTAERDPAGRALLIAGADKTSGFVRRFDLDTNEAMDLPIPSRIVDIVWAGPDTFVAVGEEWFVYQIRGNQVTPVEIAWDDPVTSPVETRPTRGESGCSGRKSVGRGLRVQAAFQAVDASQGVVWASGCDAVVARIQPFGDHPYAVAVSIPDDLRSADDSLLDPRISSFQAARALGPGWALVAGTQFDDSLADTPHVVELYASSVRGALTVRRYPELLPPESGRTGHTSGSVMDLVGDHPNVVVVHSHDEGGFRVLRSADRPFRMPLGANAGAILDDALVVAYRAGYVAVSRLQNRNL